jgi:hypothetical protein
VSPARALIVVCSVLALSACGSAKSVQPADDAPVAVLPSPRIEAIDEPADTWWLDEPSDGDSASASMCLGDCSPTPKLKEQLRRERQDIERATTPAKGSEPRAVARLRLEQGGSNAQIRLIAWKNQSGEICLADDETDENGDGGSGPFGPCVPGGDCGEICLGLSGSSGGAGTEWRNTLAGVLPAKADLLRITFDGGREASYKLDGPLVPGFPEYRVFMLDLGSGIETRLELLDGGKVIAEEKRSRAEIIGMRCSQRYPVDNMPRTPEEAQKSPLAQCFQKAAPK